VSALKDLYWDLGNKHCYGTYQPSSLCDTCWTVEACKEETIKRDGYYDQQAERAWWLDYVEEVEKFSEY